MDAQPFRIWDLLKRGWRLTFDHLGYLLVYQLIMFMIMVIFSGPRDTRWMPLHLIGIVLSMLVKMGLYHSILMILDGIKPQFDELYKHWQLLLSWIVASFVFGFLFVLGLILFVAPGLWIWAKYGFFPFFIIDKGLGPFQALEAASEATKGIRWKVLLLFLTCLGVNIAISTGYRL
jgi:hypothetical protein